MLFEEMSMKAKRTHDANKGINISDDKSSTMSRKVMLNDQPINIVQVLQVDSVRLDKLS